MGASTTGTQYVTVPGGAAEAIGSTMVYDLTGNLLSLIDRNGNVTQVRVRVYCLQGLRLGGTPGTP